MENNISPLLINLNTGMRILLMLIILAFAIWKRGWLAISIVLTSMLSLVGTYIFHWDQGIRLTMGTLVSVLISLYIVQTEANRPKRI
jgi:hypothetical protein